MKLCILTILIFSVCACNNKNSSTKEIPQIKQDSTQEKIDFFPVTAYIKGQLYDITVKGLTPIKYTTSNNHTDSVMVKFDQLNNLVAEFLHPEIDSTNLSPFYTESKFLDQSIDAFTFTYDAKTQLPDSLPLNHWDVYINPATSKVKRIYLVKKVNNNKLLQLTWQSDKWCKITTILNNPDGTSTIEKEEKISWDY